MALDFFNRVLFVLTINGSRLLFGGAMSLVRDNASCEIDDAVSLLQISSRGQQKHSSTLQEAQTSASLAQAQKQLEHKASESIKYNDLKNRATANCWLYVGILSSPSNFQRRAAVRNAYLNTLRETSTSKRIIAEFIIGHQALEKSIQGELPKPEQQKIERELQWEAEEHGDIHRIVLPELYQNLPDKSFSLLQSGLDADCDFVMKIDDDRILNLTSTTQLLATRDPEELLYAGYGLFYKQLSVLQDSADHTFAPYFSGWCYLLSRKLAHQIVEVHRDHSAAFMEYGQSSEDLVMGKWVHWEEMQGQNVTFKTQMSMCYHKVPMKEVQAVVREAMKTASATLQANATPPAEFDETANIAAGKSVDTAVPPLSMGLETETCLEEMRQSVEDAIGTHLKQAPKPFLFWDPAMYANIGENLNSIAELALLKPYSPDICCAQSCAPDGGNVSKCPLNPDDVKKGGWGTVILQGGGNWGDLYAQPQESRLKVLESLANCCPETVIISMPQSLFYNHTEKAAEQAFRIESAVKKFTTPPIFFWRDHISLANASAMYPTASNILTPEVVWALNSVIPPNVRQEFQHDVLVAGSEESVGGWNVKTDAFKSKTLQPSCVKSSKKPLKATYSTSWDNVMFKDPYIYPNGRYNKQSVTFNTSALTQRLNYSVTWLRSAPFVVTDNLHITLLSMLSGSKVVLVDNIYGKIKDTIDFSLAIAGSKCAKMRSALLGAPTDLEQRQVNLTHTSAMLDEIFDNEMSKNVPAIAQAASFESAARMLLGCA